MTPLASTRVALSFALLGLLAISCGGGVDASSPVLLGALDPDLLVNARSLVFTFSTTQTCADLVDLSPAEMGSALEDAQENAPLQRLDASASEHVFGKVDPDVPIAYFVLASVRAELDPQDGLSALTGSVFAFGCRDFLAPSGSRHDLPITLFPIGLR